MEEQLEQNGYLEPNEFGFTDEHHGISTDYDDSEQAKEVAPETETPEEQQVQSEQPQEQTEEQPEKAKPAENYSNYHLFADQTPPEKFDSIESELNYYKSLADNTKKFAESDDFAKLVAERYQDALANIDENYVKLQQMQNAMQNPKEFVQKYFGDKLSEIGVQTKYTSEEIDDMVAEDMAKKFGEEWENYYDPEMLKKPMSLTSQMHREREQLVAKYQEENQQLQATPTQAAPAIDEQQLQQVINQGYQELSKQGVTQEDYNEFLTKLDTHSREKGFNLSDYHKIMNFDSYIEKAKQEARKEMAQELKGGKSVKPTLEPQEQEDEEQPLDEWSWKRKLHGRDPLLVRF